jgi:hypothetical protein
MIAHPLKTLNKKMTEKQAEKYRLKIKKLKNALAADKRRCGGYYDDSRGLRYLPPQYYIKLGDFSGGLRYLKWFDKNFPDDTGFPDFLFEWVIILFKTGNLKQAEQKAFGVFYSNTYIFDKFFNRPIVAIDKYENSNIDVPSYVESFNYSCSQTDLEDFTEWLDNLIKSDRFVKVSQKLVDIFKKLKTEKDRELRIYLLQQARQLRDNFLFD